MFCDGCGCGWDEGEEGGRGVCECAEKGVAGDVVRAKVVVMLTVMKPTSPHLNHLQTILFHHDLEISHGRYMAHGESDATIPGSIGSFYEMLSSFEAVGRFH